MKVTISAPASANMKMCKDMSVTKGKKINNENKDIYYNHKKITAPFPCISGLFEI